MEKTTNNRIKRPIFSAFVRRLALILSVIGPATIAAMADNDAGGVATYSVAGARLGYPVLFLLGAITILLAITQEMGMRLTLVTRRGLADLIREKYGARIAVFIFAALLIANLGTITVNLSAVKTTAHLFNIPNSIVPVVVIATVLIAFLFVTRGSYRMTQNIMLLVSLFYLTYIISAIKAQPDWGMALSNLIYPHGVEWTSEYLRSYLIIGMGVLGTTITPWGQFFISSFAGDKKMEKDTLRYSQIETYWGAFLTDFFSFFMIVATAATLFVHNLPLTSGDQAAEAIRPFAGDLASKLFAIGILNAAFMGLVVISLSTAYAFSEFFGVSGSLDSDYKQSRSFYVLFFIQLIVALFVVMLPFINLFSLAIATQILNAVMLPLVFLFLIRLTSDEDLMGEYGNTSFKRNFAIAASVVITIAAALTVVVVIFNM
jgi:NRAMP (natural resistance-associated macrophage protein)-like metal ion transporter